MGESAPGRPAQNLSELAVHPLIVGYVGTIGSSDITALSQCYQSYSQPQLLYFQYSARVKIFYQKRTI